MTLDERPRGILSPADRRYLKNPDEYSSQAAFERRRAISERIHESLHDYPLLLSLATEELRREGFEDRDLEKKDHTLNVLSSAFAFLYLGITDTVEPAEAAKDAFERVIADGVRQAYLQEGETVKNISIDLELDTGPSVEELKKQENPDVSTLLQLFEAGELSRDELEEYVELTPLDETTPE
jgi:hypothetical protein